MIWMFPAPLSLRLLSLLLLLDILLYWLVWVLDCQTPDVKVIADRPDDIDNEASVHTHSQSKTHEDKRDLVNTVA